MLNNGFTNVLRAYECLNNDNIKHDCEHCQYGFKYWEDRYDGRPYWSCDTEGIEQEMYQWLKIYEYILQEQNHEICNN